MLLSYSLVSFVAYWRQLPAADRTLIFLLDRRSTRSECLDEGLSTMRGAMRSQSACRSDCGIGGCEMTMRGGDHGGL